jgi:hypothetical protein
VLQLRNLLSSFARATGVNVSDEFKQLEADALGAAEARIATIEARVPDVVKHLEEAAAPDGPIVQAIVNTSGPLITQLVEKELEALRARITALEAPKV